MTEIHSLPPPKDELAEILDRRFDLLFQGTFRGLCHVFGHVMSELKPLLEETKHTMEAAAADARLEGIPVDRLARLPRLLTLCKDVDTLLTSFERIIQDHNLSEL